MDIQKIDQVLGLITKTNFIEVEVEEDGLRIKARKPAPLSKAVKAAEAPPPTTKASTNEQQILSPLVGTFYRAPSPNSHPLAEVGDVVKKGQVLCIVEAMKLMNEVWADTEGKIIAIYVENAEPVEYGEPLFLIDTSVQCPKGNGHGRKVAASAQQPVRY